MGSSSAVHDDTVKTVNFNYRGDDAFKELGNTQKSADPWNNEKSLPPTGGDDSPLWHKIVAGIIVISVLTGGTYTLVHYGRQSDRH